MTDYSNFTAQDILDTYNNLAPSDISSNFSGRIVGFYAAGGADLLVAGGEYVRFIGVDTQNNNAIITANYLGALIGPSSLPASGAAGAFSFDGGPESLDGFSIGFSAGAVATVGMSFGLGSPPLRTFGAQTDIALQATGGYTYQVRVNGTLQSHIEYRGRVDSFDYDFTGSQYDLALDSLVNSPLGRATIEYNHPDGFVIKQTLYRVDDGDGYKITVLERLLDQDGNRVPNSIAQNYISTQAWSFDLNASQVSNIRSNDECFTAGTQITMWDNTTKNIEDIRPDDIVKSYDDTGKLVPGRVSKTFQNIAKHILNVHGLEVTPGHATLCGEGAFAGQHVPIIDIIRSDAAIVREDGTMIRVNTNCEVGSYEDQFVLLAIGEMNKDGLTLRDKGRVRIGSRFILPDGRDMSIAEILSASGAHVNADGLVKSPTLDKATPLHLSFLDALPKVEDYILARSGVTLSEIYQADEWEAVRPQMPAPIKVYKSIDDVPPEEILKAEAYRNRPQRLH